MTSINLILTRFSFLLLLLRRKKISCHAIIYGIFLVLSLPQTGAAKEGSLYCLVLEKKTFGIHATSDLCVPLIKTRKNTYQPYIPPNSDSPVLIPLHETRRSRQRAQRVLFLVYHHLLFQFGLTNLIPAFLFTEKDVRNSKAIIWILEAISLIKNSQMSGSGAFSYPFSLTNILFNIMKLFSEEETSQKHTTHTNFFDALPPMEPSVDLSKQDTDYTTIDIDRNDIDRTNFQEPEHKVVADQTTNNHLKTLLLILPMFDPLLPSSFVMIALGGLVKIDPQSPFLKKESWETENNTITLEELFQENFPPHIQIEEE